MPYVWHDMQAAPDHPGAVCHELIAWPYRSLSRPGFVWFIAITAGLLLVPMLALIGTAILWIVLPFVLAAIAAIWIAIDRSYRSGAAREVLHFDAGHLELTRHDFGRPDRHFETNPYWLRVEMRDGPVEDYLTLAGSGREVELGAFLTPAERRQIDYELRGRLRRLREEIEPPPRP